MKYIVIAISFLLVSCAGYAEIPQQEKYRSHQVQQGETVNSIAEKYNISAAAIYQLNPDAKNGIGPRNILIIPLSEVKEDPVVASFKKHKVRRKETLFSIAMKYNVTVDDIKKYNKHLYASSLKKGERIHIPVYPKENTTIVETTESSSNNSGNTDLAVHVVAPKETKYGIARKYGISIPELEALNPNMPGNLPIGTELFVPKETVIETATIEEGVFDFYEVQPKEGFYRLKVKLGLTQEEIVALNPYAKDGLKEGMILKIPKEISESLGVEDASKVNLEDRIANMDKKRLTVMLPFQLRKADSDSVKLQEEVMKNNRLLRISLDFYSGVLMAAEFAKDKGISTYIDVIDTEGSEQMVSSKIEDRNWEDMDAVIGPLLSKNVEKAATMLRNRNIPVFSPLSNRNIRLTSNLFQTLPNDDLLEQKMIKYLKDNLGERNIIVISDKGRAKQKQALLAAFPNAVTLSPREEGFLYVVDIDKVIDRTRENWVVLESKDPVIVSNVVGLLNGMPSDTHKIRLFTTDKNDSYDYHDISNMHLANLGFTFPSVSKSYDYSDKDAFVVSYKNKYGVLPNRFAVRGFDLTYDILLRLAAEGNVYDASEEDIETEYVENKFRYSKKMFSGYNNQGFYILKYTEDLQFEEVK
ncbi:PBP1 and LysM peptidoglycan-binding domain-containing protein [Aureisphaera galaxeae]|uniref:PBP1 and LysM peptidoglycan-binding domain-containing protein n=1 Tax=Aureisphaera galaxeae TaxID=1538023 RepID=UPI002350C004|nr:LysM peptidoglycan-binding domain-containing protein [Aureisphaera galaxeae]